MVYWKQAIVMAVVLGMGVCLSACAKASLPISGSVAGTSTTDTNPSEEQKSTTRFVGEHSTSSTGESDRSTTREPWPTTTASGQGAVTTTALVAPTTVTTTATPTTTTTATATTTTASHTVQMPHIDFYDGTGEIAVWWWSKDDAVNPAIRDTYLQFLQDNQVTEIYAWMYGTTDEQMTEFIRAAHARGMQVSFLSGDASWVVSKDMTFVNRYLEYQQSAPADARYASIHFDVEPHQLGGDADELFQLYAEYAQMVTQVLHAEGEKVEWDTPFWAGSYDVTIDGIQWNLTDYMASISDSITIMSYRDKAVNVLSISERWFQAAAQYGCQIVCGVEANYTAEGAGVSFAEDGKVAMYTQLEGVYNAMAQKGFSGGYGVAVHHMPTWYHLQD